MISRRSTMPALAVLAVSLICGVDSASGTEVIISGSGTWDASTPTTPESAPGNSFSFSFDMPNPFSGTSNGQGLVTSQGTNLIYDLNGNPVSVGLSYEVFYPSSYGGLFTIGFTDGNYLGVFGPDIGSTGTLTIGTFSAGYSVNSQDEFTPQASGPGSVSGVPEPSSLTLFGAALFGMGWIAQKKHSRVV